MQYSAVLLAVLFAAGASAQITRADFPACALPCLASAIASETDCAESDIACSCLSANNKLITAAATPCILGACEGTDISTTLAVSSGICAADNDSTPVSSSSSSSAAVVESSTSSAAVVESSTSSAAVVESSTSEAPTSTSTTAAAVSSVSASATSASGNATVSATSAPAFTGAAGKVVAGLGCVAAFALAALAL